MFMFLTLKTWIRGCP